MIGRRTHIVDCRETRGIGEGGGIAQRGTYAKSGSELVAVAMSPGRRHITKPVCEITFALREANIETSTLVLNAGSGVPKDAPGGGNSGLFGVTPKEIAQMERHNIVLFHFGGVKNHIIYKARHALRNVDKPIVIIAQYPLDFEDFAKIDIRVGTVLEAELNKKAKKPAYKLKIDFGNEIGIKKTSAQITDYYTPDELIGKQLLAVVNFPPKQIADFISEVLILGTYSTGGVILITPDKKAQNGDKLG